jgi:hypothetical protein
MSRGKNPPPSLSAGWNEGTHTKSLYHQTNKNWFIIKNKVFEGSTGTLVNLATEYGLVCPFGSYFNFDREEVLNFKLFGR